MLIHTCNLFVQALAVSYTLQGLPDGYYFDGEDAPDILAVASAAADACPSMALLSLRAPQKLQEDNRRANGHSGLLALSKLAGLTCLQLVDTAVGCWPPELSRLSKLQQLTVTDPCRKDGHYYDGWEELPWPLPHALPTLPQLRSLRSGVFSWRAPLPATLEQLVLEHRSGPGCWAETKQWKTLLRQLPRLPRLSELVFVGATWVPLRMQRLVATLQQCKQLATLQLIDCNGAIAALPPHLAGLAQLKALAIADGQRAEFLRGPPPLQLTQLTACSRLHWQQKGLAPAATLAPMFAGMPALEQLTLAFDITSCDDMWEEQINGLRGQALPFVRLVDCAVAFSASPVVEVPIAECNAVLGQQLDRLVH